MSFEGLIPDYQSGTRSGEVVFTTGMTGYIESLTDPSYAGQILNFTYPLIGNYGVCSKDFWESEKIYAQGVLVSECAPHFSHFLGNLTLQNFLKAQNVFLLAGVDTRALTKVLRENGTLRGFISDNKQPDLNCLKEMPIFKASRKESTLYGQGKNKKRVIAVDAGMKESMLKYLLKGNIEVLRAPSDYDYTKEEFDGLFLSNGPGDPADYVKEIALLQKAMERKKPIFGVCLGCQLMALAGGGSTYKLKYGHRGQNQPCMDLETQKCYITSQNHGYAIEGKSLDENWKVTHINLNDHSVEGIKHKDLPFFAVQFHPEAHPGPTDTQFLFERFCKLL